MYICHPQRVISSVGSERCLDRAEVSSSSLLSPTIRSGCENGCESDVKSLSECVRVNEVKTKKATKNNV